MEGHANIPPSYFGPTQFSTTTHFGYGGDETSNRAAMPPPRESSLAPFPESFQTPQPFQYGSQNFILGSSPPLSMFSQPPLYSVYPSATVANRNMALPPRPYVNNSSLGLGGPGSSLPSSVLPMRPPPSGLRYSPSSRVVNRNLPPKAPANNENMISELNSLLARNNRNHAKPIEMPVGVRSQKESLGVESSHEDVNIRNKRIRDAGNEPPCPPPQGVSVDVGNGNAAYGGWFTANQLSKIAVTDHLREMAESDPKRLKRIFSNRESAARSKERKELYTWELQVKVKTLETQLCTLTTELNLEKRERRAAGDECRRLKIRLQGWEENAPLHDALTEHLTGEVHRLTEEVNGHREESNRQRKEINKLTEEASAHREESNRQREEISRLTEEASAYREESSRQRKEISRLMEKVNEYHMREKERMYANMVEQLNINPPFEENPYTNYTFE